MKTVFRTTEIEALALQDAVDTALGYPCAPDGGGQPPPGADPHYGWTLHDGEVIKHAARDEWHVTMSDNAVDAWPSIRAEVLAHAAASGHDMADLADPADPGDDFYPPFDDGT